MSRTSQELKKLEDRRAQLLKLEASGKGGPVAAIYAELSEIDESIARAMGISVQALGKMRGK